MEQYNVLVLMEKDKDSGFFTQTVDSYSIEDGIELIENAYLIEESGEYYIYLTLTTSDVEDWQYYGIYDLYDEGIYDALDVELLDGSGEYNPRWIVKIKYSENRSEMEKRINDIVKLHTGELAKILPDINANKEKYIEEANEEE
ncbi:MAG: DUF6762 family protein [Caulobacteraceae bacterium]